MDIILTFDVGTTSMKCCAFDTDFNLIDSSTAEYALDTRGEHIVEADPLIYWDGMCKSIKKLFSGNVSKENVVACGITTQGETSIVLDRHGDPLRPAIVWLDDRAESEAAFLSENISAEKFYKTTGMPEIGGALPLAKLKMVLSDKNTGGKVSKVLLLEDYLVYKLTGVISTEHSLICSTGYYNITARRYCDEFLNLAGASADLLPEVMPCGSIAGTVTDSAARDTSLPAGIPVVLTAMDQTSSAIGAGNIESGIVTETTGTCLTVAATADKPDFNTGVALQYYTHYNGKYLALAYNATAAIIMKWFKDEFIAATDGCRNSSLNAYDYMSSLASEIAPGSDGLIMLPHFAGKAMPDFCPDVRGCFYGVSINTKKGHFIRAIMEGVSYMLRENLESFKKAGIAIHEIRSLGGGARDAEWSKIKASVTGSTLITTDNKESTSLGAAILCANALGLGEVPILVMRAVKLKDSYTPNVKDAEIYGKLYEKYLKLDRAITALHF